jgi:hypothetical protein
MTAEALAPFAALIGTWDTEAKHVAVDFTVTGHWTFEWLHGGHYVLVRSHNDHPQFPDGLVVIGAPEEGDGLVAEYFDDRGVRRTYNVAIEDGVLRWWRDAPEFDQRLTAVLGENEFDGEFELATSPGAFKHDMTVTFRRRVGQDRAV